MTDLATNILIDMTQGFSIAETNVMRGEADEVVDVMDMDFPIEGCRCDAGNVCVASDAVLGQSDPLKLCVRFQEGEDGELPPAFVKMFDVKTFTCTQGASAISPILNYERQNDAGLTAVEMINTGTGIDGRILTVDAMLPSNFYGAEQRPVDCTGTVVFAFAEEEEDDGTSDNTDDRRVLRETTMTLRAGTISTSSVERRAETLNESESDFAVEVMLAKATEKVIPGVGLIVGAVVGSVLVAGTVGAAIMAKFNTAAANAMSLQQKQQPLPKAQSSITEPSSSMSSSNMDVGFQLEQGICA